MNKNHLQLIEQDQQVQPIHQVGMIMPAATIDQAVEQFQLYQQLKKRIGTPEDFQIIGGKQHPKKSFVRKVQRFFNVSCEIIQDEPLRDENGKIIAWLARARAIHLATGAFQEADGSCSFDEKAPKQRTIHNIRAHAITRAKNRAILDLVGFGEVSAEEIIPSEYDEPIQQPNNVAQYTKPIYKNPKGAFFAEASRWKLTDKQQKAIVFAFTDKESRKDLTDEEYEKLVYFLKNASEEDIRRAIAEGAEKKKKMQQEESQVYNVDPETGEVTITIDDLEEIDQVLEGGDQ